MPQADADKKLVERCLAGDRIAQKILFERFGRQMMGVCLRYARHRHEAEDMLQDGFVRVYKYLHTFNFEGPLGGWIRRVIVNACLRTVNKKSFSHEEIGLPEYHDRQVSEKAISNLHTEELINHIQNLPDGYRAVFNLYVVEGYSHKEIAEQLGCGESTSRSQLSKAKKLLQKMILAYKTVVV